MNPTQHFLALLDEAFDRPPTSWAHFTSGGGRSSYFGTLDQLNYLQAQQTHAGNSIAAQTKHVTFVVRVAAASISGNPDSPDAEQWNQSWKLSELDSEMWERLCSELREAYSELRHVIRETSITDDDTFATIAGVITHVAYHLGAVRCKAETLDDT